MKRALQPITMAEFWRSCKRGVPWRVKPKNSGKEIFSAASKFHMSLAVAVLVGFVLAVSAVAPVTPLTSLTLAWAAR